MRRSIPPLPGRWKSLLEPAARLAKRRAYLVGGSLRDLVLGRETADLDLACEEPARALAARLAAAVGGTLVALDEDRRVYRVAGPKGARTQYDVAQIQGRGIEDDLNRRDFTVNAMAARLVPGGLGDVIDPRGGMADMRRKVIRADIPAVLDEDPLRLLRAFRIAAQLDFEIEPATLRAIRSRRRRAAAPSGERIRTELMGMLCVRSAHRWLRKMDEAGVLTSLFPPLEDARKCAEVYYGKGGVLKHTLDAAERMDLLICETDSAFPGIGPDIRGHFEAAGGLEAQAPILRLGVLLHDIAKPATARRIGGRLRFFGHDALGADMAGDIMRRLRFSRDEIDAVSAYVRHHLRPGNLAANRVISDKAAFRFFRDLGSNAVGLALVCWSDHASYLPEAKLRAVLKYAAEDPHTFRLGRADAATRKTLRHLQVLGWLLRGYFLRRERVLPGKILDGNQVMKILRIAPGPKVGKAMNLLREAQAEGKVRDLESASAFLKKLRKL